uniref:NUCB1-like N-terminal domain-containing protein n=1 Tax=Romanomermis culicivorax TaxID=13658 RepID=A0A915IPQ2_ROMCU
MTIFRRPIFIAFFSFFVWNFIAAPPVLESNSKTTLSPAEEQEKEKWGLEYGKYVKEVISVLESDPVFAEKIKNASEEDVKSGKIAQLLDFVGHDLRTKLDELKRVELEKLRFYADEKEKLRQLPGHLGHEKPNFDENDLKALMLQTSKDLEIINEKIELERKRQEMKLEYENRRRKQQLSGAELEKTLKEEELAKRQAQDVKMNHPVSGVK